MRAARRTITINGLNVAYYKFGHGPPLLFLHGGRVQAITFKRSLEELSKRYTIIAPDIPGYGASDTPKKLWSFADYAVFFNDFLESQELRDITLVGYSMGGGIAFNLAAITNRVKRLVLADASGLRIPDIKRTSHQDVRRFLFYIVRPMYYGTLLVLLRDYTRFIWKHRGDHAHMRRIRHTCLDTAYDSALQNIAVSTFILWGQNDRAIPLATAYKFQKLIARAGLKTVKANHDWPLYMPLLFSKSVL